MNSETNHQILEGIRSKNNRTFLLLYRHNLPKLTDYITSNNGCNADAKNVLQEAITEIYRKMKTEIPQINGSFENYLLDLCKSIWLKKRQHQRKFTTVSGEKNTDLERPAISHEKSLVKSENLQFISQYFKTIPFAEIPKKLRLITKSKIAKKIYQSAKFQIARKNKYSSTSNSTCGQKQIKPKTIINDLGWQVKSSTY